MSRSDDDGVAERIADRGRDALLSRLRPAFAEAAEAHSDLIELDADELEAMVQRAADRADGLQWRRALAAVATKELGIGLGDALSHPAVARAQTILGAPSYEDSLAELVAERDRADADESPDAETVADDADELALAEAEATVEDAEYAALATRRSRESDAEGAAEELPPATDPTTLRVIATHVVGIAGLSPGESGLELELSDHGLDISRGGGILGRLQWQEIEAIKVPLPRSRWRRRQRDAEMVIKTAQGTARFSIPALTPAEFRDLVEPVTERNRPATGR